MVYVMNEKLFHSMQELFRILKSQGVDMPWYSVADNGQRLSLYWTADDKTVAGDMTIHRIDLSAFVIDELVSQAVFQLDALLDAVNFVKKNLL